MIDKPTLGKHSQTHPTPRVPDHELLRCIGRGSYGEVWLARNTLGTYRAIKVVFRDSFQDSRPFEREYTGIRKYEPVSRTHPGLVDILQVGRNEAEGYFYYVMELADDASIQTSHGTRSQPPSDAEEPGLKPGPGTGNPDTYVARTLSRERSLRGRIPAKECIALGVTLSSALAELHRHSLIHRDIKPSNIIFVDGIAKLADIGLVTDAAEPLSYVGTEGFIPPEGPNAPQADIFSLGKVLYEIAMNKDRLDFPEPATAMEAFPDCETLVELNAILLQACHPDRRRRYASAAEMLSELERLNAGQSILSRRNSRRRLRWMAMAAGSISIITAAAFTLERLLDSHTQALQGKSSTIRPSLVGKIAPRASGLPEPLIDLSPFYTAPLNEKWYPGPLENTLKGLPSGLQHFGAVQFDVRGLVQLAGGEIGSYGADLYPTRVRGIFIGRWIQRLHFLHGSISEVEDGKVIGKYHIYYNTGRSVQVPMIYGRNVRSLWQARASNGVVSNAVVAWSGQNPVTQARGLELRVYRFDWENPWPAEEIVSTDFESTMSLAAPFLIALTAEDAPLSASQRRVSATLVQTLQGAARSFSPMPVRAASELFQWSPFKLNEHSVEIGGRYYDGFRFTTPPGESMDLIWGFSPWASAQGWFILPMTGRLKIGFEDWYHGSPGKPHNGSLTNDFVVQFLTGKKLEPDREYFIWFGSDTNATIELKAALRFVPAGRADPNQPGELAKSLGLPLGDGAGYHRHFCLGAIH